LRPARPHLAPRKAEALRGRSYPAAQFVAQIIAQYALENELDARRAATRYEAAYALCEDDPRLHITTI